MVCYISKSGDYTHPMKWLVFSTTAIGPFLIFLVIYIWQLGVGGLCPCWRPLGRNASGPYTTLHVALLYLLLFLVITFLFVHGCFINKNTLLPALCGGISFLSLHPLQEAQYLQLLHKCFSGLSWSTSAVPCEDPSGRFRRSMQTATQRIWWSRPSTPRHCWQTAHAIPCRWHGNPRDLVRVFFVFLFIDSSCGVVGSWYKVTSDNHQITTIHWSTFISCAVGHSQPSWTLCLIHPWLVNFSSTNSQPYLFPLHMRCIFSTY